MQLFKSLPVFLRWIGRITGIGLILWAWSWFAWAEPQPIVVLLSSTDKVGSAANEQLLIGIRRHLPADQSLKVVRLDDFSHFRAAWQAVLQLKPRLMISPLHKADVLQVIQSSPHIPVIALNQSPISHPQVWQFALTAEQPVYQLALHLAEKGMTELLLLGVNTPLATRLSQSFLAVQEESIKEHLRYKNSEQLLAGLYAITGYHNSHRRIQALAQLIDEPVVAMPWLRQDVEALVLFAPLADALEVSHRVDYAWGQSFSLYWVDTGANATSDYVRSLPNWGRMKSFMPFYQVEAMQQQRSKADSFFTALGEDAIRVGLARLSSYDAVKRIQLTGATGYLSLDAEQRIHARWPLVWLGDGQVEVIDEGYLAE